MKLYDATLPIHEKMVIFPGDPPFTKEPVSQIQTGDDFNLTRITMGTHLGTHVDPPAHYGMITFENGGRSMFDFTDYETGKVEVGLPVRMVFRIRNYDKQRGFVQYYWKAKPIMKTEVA